MLKIVNKTVCNTRFGFIAMNGQSKISTFFTQSGTKRSSSGSVSDNADDMKPSPKKLRQTEENVSPGKENNHLENKELRDISLSPEQKSKIEQKKYEALAKLNEKRTNGMLVNVGRTWYNALEEEFKKPYFIELSKFVATERSKGKVFPPAEDVFCWTNYCDIKDVKVVILGQDPYHGPNQAHGLCFSVQKGIQPPPSLQNMYKELENDIPGFKHPGHGTLIGWAKQGVLLLNACLTVRAHQANSHKDKGWEKLTDAVVSWLNKNRSQLVFILWGSYAQKKGAYIDKKKHHILKGVHPSPLSAHRGYFGCKHFSKCNELLKEAGKSTIDWSRLPPQD